MFASDSCQDFTIFYVNYVTQHIKSQCKIQCSNYTPVKTIKFENENKVNAAFDCYRV